jgi:hypothetical protein
LAVIGRQVRVRIGGRDRRRRQATGHGQRKHGAADKRSHGFPPAVSMVRDGSHH